MNKKPTLFNIIGRWERCRYVDRHGLGSSYFLDRKWNTFIPVDKDRWFQSPQGKWYPIVSGGAGSRGGWNQGYGFISNYLDMENTVSSSSVLTSNNYAFGVGGNAAGWRIILPQAKTLSSWFYRIQQITGSPGDLTLEIRTDDGTSARPSSTTVLSTTHTPNAAIGWNELGGLSTSLSADTIYWFIIGDAAGSGGNNRRVSTFLAGPGDGTTNPGSMNLVTVTTNGWTTNPAASSGPPMNVLYFSDGTAWGNPFSTFAEPTNDGDQKGFYIDGFPTDVRLFAVTFGAGTPTDPVGINIWSGVTGPAGSPFSSSTISYNTFSTTVPAAFGWTEPFPLLAARSPYRIVMDFGAGTSNGVPDILQFGTVHGGGESRMALAIPGQGNWYYTEEDGVVWSDSVQEFPRMGLFIDDFSPTGGIPPISNTRDYPLIPSQRAYPLIPVL
jgi:hypothetical protein